LGEGDRVKEMQQLLEIMARLRDPVRGCPWDREQDFASIAPYTIEEAYEVDDAIRRGDMEDLLGELGDLLLQVVYHAQMASEAGHFDFEQVAAGIAEKLVRRHPHVFEQSAGSSPEEVRRTWEATKAQERSERATSRGVPADPFSGVPEALPALMRAAKLQARIQGSEGAESAEVLNADWVRRLQDLPGQPASRAAEELGDALFASVALARVLGVDPEAALRDANARFEASVREAVERPV
jgi:MazG family protein